MQWREEAWLGIREGMPIFLGYLPLGFAFGILANQAGLSIGEAAAMSALVYAGSAQYIAIGILAAGGSALTIIMTNLLVNLRYMLFSTSLIPYLKSIPSRLAAGLMLGLTDETYAVSVVHYKDHQATAPYVLGLNMTAYVAWVASTILGAAVGHMITNTDRFGLNFALPALYVILLVLVTRTRKQVWVALISAVVCLGLSYVFPATLHNLSNIIIAALVAASVGVMMKS